MHRIAARIVRHGPLPPAAQLVAAATPALADDLAANPWLCAEAWYALWPARPAPPASRAVELVSRRLADAQIDHVLACETRSTPLVKLLEHNRLDPARQRVLVSRRGRVKAVATALVAQQWVDRTLVPELAAVAGGLAQLGWLASAAPEVCDDAQAAALLASIGDWWGAERKYRERSRLLIELFNRRPALLGALNPGMDPAVLTAAAGVRHLTARDCQLAVAGLEPDGTPARPLDEVRFAIFALVYNPVCRDEVADLVVAAVRSSGTVDPIAAAEIAGAVRDRRAQGRACVSVDYAELDDSAALSWIINRSRRYYDQLSGRERLPRPWDLAAVAGNPHLNDVQAEQLLVALWDAYVIDALGLAAVRDLVAGLAERHAGLAPRAAELLATGDWRPREDTAATRPEARPPEPEQVAAVAGLRLAALGATGEWAAATAYAADRIGDRSSMWETFFSLADTFDGTVAELVDSAAAITPAV